MIPRELRVVGTPVVREDAVDKVTGAARYTTDLLLPGMLHAAILTSPHASARIVRIDTELARAAPGVRAVLTGADLDVRLGLYLRDKRILARDVVRYQGEAVAAVAADTLDAARDCLSPLARGVRGASRRVRPAEGRRTGSAARAPRPRVVRPHARGLLPEAWVERRASPEDPQRRRRGGSRGVRRAHRSLVRQPARAARADGDPRSDRTGANRRAGRDLDVEPVALHRPPSARACVRPLPRSGSRSRPVRRWRIRRQGRARA